MIGCFILVIHIEFTHSQCFWLQIQKHSLSTGWLARKSSVQRRVNRRSSDLVTTFPCISGAFLNTVVVGASLTPSLYYIPSPPKPSDVVTTFGIVLVQPDNLFSFEGAANAQLWFPHKAEKNDHLPFNLCIFDQKLLLSQTFKAIYIFQKTVHCAICINNFNLMHLHIVYASLPVIIGI